MAANHLTLEEAAARLDMTVDEFKRKLKTDPQFKDLDRGKIRDGTSFRFKESAVEELGRELGAGSNPENPLPRFSDSSTGHDSDDFKITPDEPKAPAKKPAKADDEPLKFATEDEVFSLTGDEPKPEGKPKPGSDSDVRLEGGKPKKGKGEESVPTEELSIDFSGPGSAVIKGGSSAKLSAPKSSGKLTSDSGKSIAKPGTGDSSEFELSLDADSDDFELKLNTEASDEVALGDLPKDAPGGSRRGGESGILSRKPNDSGPSLEKGKEKEPPAVLPGMKEESSDSDVDFELTLDSSAAVSGTKLGDLKGKKLDTGSDSEFELTLDDSGDSGLEHAALGSSAEASKGDIFETDFEIPPMDESASEAVTLDSDTDIDKVDSDIALDDDTTDAGSASGSEVVLLEDEDEAPVARKGRGKRPAADEDEGDVDLADVDAEEEEEGSAASALKGAKGRRRDEDEDEEEPPVVGPYRPVPWGVVPTLFLAPAFALTLIGGLVGFELLQTMWGYQQPQKPSAPLVRGIAKQLEMDLKEQ